MREKTGGGSSRDGSRTCTVPGRQLKRLGGSGVTVLPTGPSTSRYSRRLGLPCLQKATIAGQAQAKDRRPRISRMKDIIDTEGTLVIACLLQLSRISAVALPARCRRMACRGSAAQCRRSLHSARRQPGPRPLRFAGSVSLNPQLSSGPAPSAPAVATSRCCPGRPSLLSPVPLHLLRHLNQVTAPPRAPVNAPSAPRPSPRHHAERNRLMTRPCKCPTHGHHFGSLQDVHRHFPRRPVIITMFLLL